MAKTPDAHKLTSTGVALSTIGLTLLGLGILMGNLELLLAATLPLLLVAVSLASRPRGEARGARTLSTRAPRRGDDVDVSVLVEGPRGSDLVEVHAPVPAGFSLAAGSNLVLVAGSRAVARFRLRAHARGAHTLAPVRVETIDPRGLVAPSSDTVTPEETVNVTARAFHAQKLRRRVRGRARLMLPDREEARVGVGSTDFRELREYLWGDPPKSINWKATARRLTMQGGRGMRGLSPLVNEYEKEGRTTALVLLDGGAHMRVGTSLETGLDHAVEASLSAARLFLARGVRVGAATFGAKSAPPAAPDSGSGQIPGIERALSPGEPDEEMTPARVVGSLQRHLAGSRPIVLVVTRVTPRTGPEIAEMIRHLRVLVGERRRRLSVHVLDVRALGLAPARAPAWDAARRLVEAEDEAAARALASAGARVVAWDPAREDFRSALFRREIA